MRRIEFKVGIKFWLRSIGKLSIVGSRLTSNRVLPLIDLVAGRLPIADGKHASIYLYCCMIV